MPEPSDVAKKRSGIDIEKSIREIIKIFFIWKYFYPQISQIKKKCHSERSEESRRINNETLR